MLDPNRLIGPLLAGSLALPLVAQELQLDVRGISMPGQLELDAHPGLFPFEPVLFIPSLTTGPIPLQLIDPNDFRSLSVRADLLDQAWVGLVDPSTCRSPRRRSSKASRSTCRR